MRSSPHGSRVLKRCQRKKKCERCWRGNECESEANKNCYLRRGSFDLGRSPRRRSARELRSISDETRRLLIIAADHTARGMLDVGSNETAMANRYDLLDRLITALEIPGVDGVLGTPDIIDDLLLLGALDQK